jgi:CubicO group peptidase (beta-lactamase class C family)
MKQSKRPLRAAGLIFVCAAAFGSAPDGGEKAARIDRFLTQYADDGAFSGAVLVSEHDRVIFKKGYALANREWNVPNSPDTKFRLGSITKQFTSMLVMQQVAAGTIRLDAHLPDYLPYYRKDTGSRVTVHHLLNHTSGIPSYTDDRTFFPERSRDPYEVDAFVKRFCSGDLQFEPGTKFHYNNSGYFLLGAVLEHVTGKKYEALLKEKILDPVGMADTGYDHSADILPKRASGYQRGLGEILNAPYLDMSQPYAAGSLYSTVDDLYKWDQALYSGKLLAANLQQKIFTPGLERYGYGWMIDTLPAGDAAAGQTMIGHGGGINGFNTLEHRIVGDHDLILLFNNIPGGNLDEMARGIRAILYGQPPKPMRRSLVNRLGATIARRGVVQGIAEYRELKRTDPIGYDFAEGRLNTIGHMLLERKRTADAIAIFTLNAEEYPRSANAYDGLGDAYEQSGQLDLATTNYRKAVEINPKDQHAADKVKTLEKR